ncbi:MAG TPA: ribonuclease H-like domain-containing protein [Patescibacteria group bacterium]|nr:ribonuclease H-like domain-containing protein [Patescibacteria group bacterium]
MDTFVFDIETIGENFDVMDDMSKADLTKWIKKDCKSETEFENRLLELKDGLGFSPLTGEIVAIGLYSCEGRKGVVYYQAPGEKFGEKEEDDIQYKQMTEPEMLTKFWELAGKCEELVSFNGRSFDVPYLMLRSAIHKIRPSKDLMNGRYLYQQRLIPRHIDLYDQMTFYGAMNRKGSLHMFTRAFGIESPKSEEVNGNQVAKMFKEKRFLDIARYNAADIRATKKLYEYWNQYLRF